MNANAVDTSRYDYVAIEPGRYGGYALYGYDEYPEHSVLAGQTRRSFLDGADTAEELAERYPGVGAADSGAGFAPNMPSSPPSWFDPACAGEAWGEDDY